MHIECHVFVLSGNECTLGAVGSQVFHRCVCAHIECDTRVCHRMSMLCKFVCVVLQPIVWWCTEHELLRLRRLDQSQEPSTVLQIYWEEPAWKQSCGSHAFPKAEGRSQYYREHDRSTSRMKGPRKMLMKHQIMQENVMKRLRCASTCSATQTFS